MVEGLAVFLFGGNQAKGGFKKIFNLAQPAKQSYYAVIIHERKKYSRTRLYGPAP
jgi:hypothetical protein